MTVPNAPQQLTMRTGYTMVELVFSMASASLLMVGLASSLFMASRLFDGGAQGQDQYEAAEVQSDMLVDLGQATSFSETSSDAVAFTVPDRTGDGVAEELAYRWNSSSRALEFTQNGTSATILENVSDFQLDYVQRFMAGGADAPSAYDTDVWGARWVGDLPEVVYHGFSEAKLVDKSNSITIPKPAGTISGDLLVGVIAIDHEITSFVATPGWNTIAYERRNNITFSVGWRIAADAETDNYKFDWDEDEEAYGWIMRFSGHDAASPIHDSAVLYGTSTLNPPSGDVTTTVDNAMIVRMGGFDDDDVTIDSSGLNGHSTITMDESKAVSGGAGYTNLLQAGNSGGSNFALTDNEQYITVTIAIAPDEN